MAAQTSFGTDKSFEVPIVVDYLEQRTGMASSGTDYSLCAIGVRASVALFCASNTSELVVPVDFSFIADRITSHIIVVSIADKWCCFRPGHYVGVSRANGKQ